MPHARLVTSFALLAAIVAGGPATSCKPKEAGAATERAWNPANDPVILRGNRTLERRFSKLPKDGKVRDDKKPWPDTFWPSRVGGIAARWNSVDPLAFYTQQASKEQLVAMSLKERAKLSPAEKYDAFLGNYSYPLTLWERRRTSPHAAAWEGLCHGVAAASLLYEEPKPVVMKNPHGIDVPFGSADVKALLALYVGYVAVNDIHFVGERCNRPLPPAANGMDIPVDVGTGFGRESLTECEDVNAGAFHLLLANLVGVARESLIADTSAGDEVWNHPILQYRTKPLSERAPQATAAPGTLREQIVETEVSYVSRGVPSWKAEEALLPTTIEKKIYRYALELGPNGDILGGEWLVKDHPDFLWRQAKPKFTSYFSRMDALVEASRTSKFKDDLTFE